MSKTTAAKSEVTKTVHGKLIEALSEIDRPGTFCTSGDIPLTMPGLEVDQLGTVALPLDKTQARKLIQLCHQAPYGKGTETLVDTDVRRVWELDPDSFQLTNPKWDALIADIVGRVQTELGLQRRKLSAHLYKLLLYEEGSFFLPHRDGEKLDRMAATLVIGLPSVHQGGELIVSHDGARHEIALAGAASGHELSYAAFYSDCEHEVRPLRSGYRLCLVYNLTLAKSRGKQGISAPTSRATVAAISELLGDWSDEDPQKLAVTFEHRYTQDGLTLDQLKGIDRARAEALFEAAGQAGCVAHLALVTLWQSGAAEGEDYDYSSYGRRRRFEHDWYDDEDEEDEGECEDASGYEMGEIYDDSLSVNHWSDRQGNKVQLGEMVLEEGEIVSEHPLDESDPSREEFEGYTGNAGMTLERWYHRAAIVIWPRDKHFAVLCAAGTDASIGGLEAMAKRLKRAAKGQRDEQRQACLDFAEAIIQSWQASKGRFGWDGRKVEVDRSVFPRVLQELDDPALVRRFLSRVVTADGAVQLDKPFAAFCKRHGWPSFQDDLSSIMDAATEATVARNVSLLETLCLQRDKNADRITLCRHLAERAVTALIAFDDKPAQEAWRSAHLDRSALLASLVKSLLAVDAAYPLSRLLDHTLSRGDKYDLTDAHLAAIFTLKSWLTRTLTEPNQEVTRWLAECRSRLESLTAQAPAKPADYRRPAELSCQCADCRELSRFLADPDEPVHRFRVRKDRRQHLHQIIDGNRCDLTHVTDRRGSPQTLVCTKTTASYEAACRIYERDRENLTRIKTLEKQIRSR